MGQYYIPVVMRKDEVMTFYSWNYDEEPDYIGTAPNYAKYDGWDVEEVLVFLNVD